MKKVSVWLSLLLSVSFFLSPLLRADDKADYGTVAGSVIVPEKLSAKDIERAVIEAGAGRGWTVKSHDEEKVVLFLDKSDWVSTITVVYNTKEVDLYSKSTRKGVPKVPTSWIKYLKQDIGAKLAGIAAAK